MKKLLLLLFIVPMISFGQNNINYQAVVYNSSGTVISSQSIDVKLSVIYTNANSGAVYSETHTTTTTSSGLINIKLGGGGTASGTFANIDWSTSTIYLKSEVNIGSGYVNMGTQQIEAVPVALYAKNVNLLDANNTIAIGGVVSATNSVAIGHNALSNSTSGDSNVAIGERSMSANNTSGSWNTAVGAATMINNTSGNENTAIGAGSLSNNQTGSQNTGIGLQSLTSNQTGIYNTAVGWMALSSSVSQSANTAMGSTALKNLLQGNMNVAIGSGSLEDATVSSGNIAIGGDALHKNSVGSNNVAVGLEALYSNTGSGTFDAGNGITWPNASSNVAVGSNALYANTTGSYNTAIGTSSLRNLVSSINNVAVGIDALHTNTSGGDNTALGAYALEKSTGSQEVAVGSHALRNNTTGGGNTAVGSYALKQSITGSQNTALGDQSGYNSTSNSSKNTFVGFKSDSVSGTYITNSIAFGANAIVTTSNTIQLGNSSVTLVQTSGTISATAFVGDGSGLTGISGPIYKSSMVLQSSSAAATDSQIDLPGLSFRWKKDSNGVGKLEVKAESDNAPQDLIFYFSYHTDSNDTINFRPDSISASTSSWSAVDCSWCASSSPPPTGYTPNLPSITGAYAVYEFDFSVYPLNTSGNHLGKTYNVKLFLGGWGGVHMRASYQ